MKDTSKILTLTAGLLLFGTTGIEAAETQSSNDAKENNAVVPATQPEGPGYTNRALTGTTHVVCRESLGLVPYLGALADPLCGFTIHHAKEWFGIKH